MNIFKYLKMPSRGAKIAEPENPRPESEAHPTVNLEQIEFLMTEDVIAQNVTVEELHRLVDATEKSLRQTLKNIPFDFDLRVRFTIYTHRTVGIDLGLQVPIEGTTLPETLQRAADELKGLDEVKITSREHAIVICAYFQVKQTN